MKERVSIVISCYNKAPYVGEAIESALNQSYSDLEVVVVDDGSTDNSAETIRRYANMDRVVVVQQPNQGVCVARNHGIRQSTGEFIVPLDADDVLESTYVQRCMEWFQKDPSTKLVYTTGNYFGEKQGKMGLAPYDFETLRWYSIIPATSMFRRKDFDDTIGYNPNMKYALEDWDFYLSLLKPGETVHMIDEPLFRYRILNRSRNTNIESHQEDIFRQIYHNHSDLYAPYHDMLLLAHDQWKEYESLYHGVYQSKAYRLGKVLLKPLSFLRYSLKDAFRHRHSSCL